MRRRLAQLAVMLRSAFRGMQHSALQALLSILTIAVALALGGSFALVVANMSGLIERADRDLRLAAFLEPGLAPDAAEALRERAESLEGVAEVVMVTPEQAMARFRSRAGAEIAEALDENPLPASLELTLSEAGRTPEGLQALRATLLALDGVDELASDSDWVESYARALAFVRSGAWVIGGALALSALLIVANTVRLAIHSRRDELDILSLVGASRGFVRTPFVIEGFAQGLLGGVVALVLLWAGFQAAVPAFSDGLTLLLGQTQPRFFDGREVFRLLATGALLGTIGATSALWRLGR